MERSKVRVTEIESSTGEVIGFETAKRDGLSHRKGE